MSRHHLDIATDDEGPSGCTFCTSLLLGPGTSIQLGEQHLSMQWLSTLLSFCTFAVVPGW